MCHFCSYRFLQLCHFCVELGEVLRARPEASGVRHVFRVPCIPGVNDTDDDRAAFHAWAHPSPVEFLPYNPAAGAKYPMLGRRYAL